METREDKIRKIRKATALDEQKAKTIQDITQMISSADIHMLLLIRNCIRSMME